MLPPTQIQRFIATAHFQRLHWSAETWKGLVEKPGATRKNRDWPCTEQQSPGMLFTPSWPWIWRPTQVQLEILIDYDLETLRILLTPLTNWKFAGKNDISMSAFTFPAEVTWVSAHLPLASTINQAQHYALAALMAGGKWIESLSWQQTLRTNWHNKPSPSTTLCQRWWPGKMDWESALAANSQQIGTMRQAQHYALPALVAGGKWIESLRWPRTLSSFGRKGLH